MNCRQVRKGLIDLFDHAPDPVLEARVLGHIGDCHACAEEYGSLKKGLEAVQPVCRVAASPGFMEKLMSEAHDKARSNRCAASSHSFRRRVVRPILAASLSVALLVGASFGLWYVRNGDRQLLTAFNVLGQAVHAMESLHSVHIAARMRRSGRS